MMGKLRQYLRSHRWGLSHPGKRDRDFGGVEEAAEFLGLVPDGRSIRRAKRLERLDANLEPATLPIVGPYTRDAAVDEDHRREPPLWTVDAFVVSRVDEVALVLHA